MTKHAVLLGGGKSQQPYAIEFKNRGWLLTVVDKNPEASAFEIADHSVCISTHDFTSMEDALQTRHSHSAIDIIFSNSSAPIVAKNCARLNSALNVSLPFTSIESVNVCYDKRRMKQYFQNAGIFVAKEFHTEEIQHLPEGQFPIIAKPRKESLGGNGVQNLEYSSDLNGLTDTHSHYLFETYIPGEEFSIDGIIVQKQAEILAISKKNVGSNEKYVPNQFSLLDRNEIRSIIDMPMLNQNIADALGLMKISNSQFSFDIKITSDGDICFIEGGIFWDAKIDRLLSFSGINPYSYFIDRMYCGSKAASNLTTRPTNMQFVYADKAHNFSHTSLNTLYPGDHIEFEKYDGEFVKPPESVADLLACRFTYRGHV